MRVLIVEDDVAISKSLVNILQKEGYFVDQAFDGDNGVYYALNEEYDVILLDVMLPKKNGFEVIKELRKNKVMAPTIMLTAKSELDDRIIGLDSGADDYMAKPFEPKELLARIRAVSRRGQELVIDEVVVVDLTLNTNTYSLSANNKFIKLSKNEFEIIKILMVNKEQVFSKEQLINKVWGFDTDIEENNVEAYISFLRKKLKFLNSKVEIATLRRLGYKLEVEKCLND